MTVRRGLHLGSDGCPMLKAPRKLREVFFTREDVNEEESIQEMQIAQKTPRPCDQSQASASLLKWLKRICAPVVSTAGKSPKCTTEAICRSKARNCERKMAEKKNDMREPCLMVFNSVG